MGGWVECGERGVWDEGGGGGTGGPSLYESVQGESRTSFSLHIRLNICECLAAWLGAREHCIHALLPGLHIPHAVCCSCFLTRSFS